MLDIEITVEPTDTALDVVSIDDMVRHLRLSPTMASNPTWRANIQEAIEAAVADLDGIDGKLNRFIMPRTVTRYLSSFPRTGVCIALPYPPLISVESITYTDGEGSPQTVPVDNYTVRKVGVGDISYAGAWPQISPAGRAVAISYKAGYETYPQNLRRLIKILAAHNIENPEASINEPRQMAINRQVDFGVSWLMDSLKIPNSYDDWE